MSIIYSNSKIFHFHNMLQNLQEGRHFAPIHVRLKPTNRCTHRCYYCCYRNPKLHLCDNMDDVSEIPIDKMKDIVSDFQEMNVKAVTLSGGGDPLCYSYIIETATLLLNAGIQLAVLTNGALLQGDISELLANEAIWIRISIDAADDNTYSSLRRVPATEFTRVCNNISYFANIRHRKCLLGLNYVITRENANDIYKFAKLGRNLGANNIKFSGIVVGLNEGDNNDYLMPIYNSAKELIHNAKSDLENNNFTIIDKFHLPEFSQEAYTRQYTSCPMARFLTVIAADMNVYTCQDKAYSKIGTLGSLKDQSFQHLWFSEILTNKLNHINPSQHCKHHCVADAKNRLLLEYLDSDPRHIGFV